VNGLAVVGIAVLMYPLLKGYSGPLALGYVGFRVAELVACLFALATPLVAIALGNSLGDGTLDGSASQQLGSLLQAQHATAIVMVYLTVSVAGGILAYLLYQTRLIPRWLAVLGVIAYPVLFVGTVLDMFDVADVTQGAGMLAVVPGGLFELILPIWLLTKGFTTTSATKQSTAKSSLSGSGVRSQRRSQQRLLPERRPREKALVGLDLQFSIWTFSSPRDAWYRGASLESWASHAASGQSI
jgi:hypothetical protein